MKRLVSICLASLVAIACDPAAHEHVVSNGPDALPATAIITAQSLAITGSAPTPGAFSQLKATATFSDGSSRDVTDQVEWRSSDLNILTISRTGLATGINAGHATIIATYENLRAVMDLTVTIALPPPINPVDVYNCAWQSADASNVERTLNIASYPRSTLSQVDVGFTSKNKSGTYSATLTILVNGADVGHRDATFTVNSPRDRAPVSFVFSPALSVPTGSSVRLIASLGHGPADGELSWEGRADGSCPVSVVPAPTENSTVAPPRIPVRIVGS